MWLARSLVRSFTSITNYLLVKLAYRVRCPSVRNARSPLWRPLYLVRYPFRFSLLLDTRVDKPMIFSYQLFQVIETNLLMS